ncbi:tetratricopeptide repeat protein [Paraflavisolibacter sp. H34]|uniref:tetratricopeptide repeat protein n=1 Tax=Huijunlia imazamoxiresistens TaxID=3127457 RepID=UPI003017B38B
MSKRWYVSFALPVAVLLAACNGNNEDREAVLKAPPYNSLTDSIRQEPQNSGLYYRRAALLLKNGQAPLAEADLRKAWALQPEEQYGLGLSGLLAAKNPDSALLFLQQATKTLPQSIALRISQAKLLQEKNQPQQALAVCNAILAQYGAQLDALELKAALLQELKQPAEALAVLEKAYSFAPSDAELAFNLAFQYAQAKNEKVLALSDSLIQKDATGRHAEPYYFKGVYFANTGNDRRALEFFDEAIRHDYYFIDAYMEKGRLQYQHQQYPQALQTFQLAATVSPTFADAYLWMGKVQQATGNKEEAKLNYQRAYGLDKTLSEAKEAADKL